MISYLLRLKKLLPTNEIQYDHHHNGNGIFDDCNGEYKFFEFVEPLFQHYLFLLIYANTTKMANMMVRLALFPASISTIVPSPKTLCVTLSPMSNFAIY